MTVRNQAELEGLRKIGKLVAKAREAMAAAVRPGLTTAELDEVGAELLRSHGAQSSPQKEYGFPGFSCISVNDEIVHGIPGSREIRPGDIVKLDVTAELDGFVADTATTVLVPPATTEGKKLVACARAAFRRAMKDARAGRPLSGIGRAVESEVRLRGFAVVRELCGHGVGRSIHEEPQVENYYEARQKTVLHDGLVIAVEPILSAKPARVVQEDDGWTYRTSNHSLAVHYEHTIVVTRSEPIILTA